MKEVALVTTSYPEAHGRCEDVDTAFVADFAAELARHARVHVVAAAAANGIEYRDGVRLHYFAVPGFPLSTLRVLDPTDWPVILAALRAGQRALDRVAAEHRLDHVLAICALPTGLLARQLERRRGISYSTWVLGRDVWNPGRLPIVRSLLRRVLRDAAHRFACGVVLAEDVAALTGVQCAFLPRCRRLTSRGSRRRAKSPPYRLAFLSRWLPEKGADLLIDALLALDESDWRAIEEVRYCGGGPLEGRVRDGFRQLSAACRPVTLGGYLDGEQAAELYTWADFVVLPSRRESIPLTFSDAVQCGAPVIAMPVGDLPRLVESYGVGYLAREVSDTALRDAIRSALRDEPADIDDGLARARADFDVAASARKFYEAIA